MWPKEDSAFYTSGENKPHCFIVIEAPRFQSGGREVDLSFMSTSRQKYGETRKRSQFYVLRFELTYVARAAVEHKGEDCMSR